MHTRMRSPLPTLLSPEIKDDSKRAPQNYQTHIHHYGRQIAVLHGPLGDELAKAVPPEVLVDGDSDKDRASSWLVTINRICACYCWEGGDLYAGAGISNNDDGLVIIRQEHKRLCWDEQKRKHTLQSQ